MGATLNCLGIVATGVEMSGSPFLNWYYQELHLLRACICTCTNPWSMKQNSEHPAGVGGCWKPASQLCIPNGIETKTFIKRLPNGRWWLKKELHRGTNHRQYYMSCEELQCVWRNCGMELLVGHCQVADPGWARAKVYSPCFFLPCIMHAPAN